MGGTTYGAPKGGHWREKRSWGFFLIATPLA